MSAYDINEVPAYKLPNGSLLPASDVQTVTAYQTASGALYESKDAARGVLIVEATRVIGSATADVVAAAAQNANNDEANLCRVAVLYLAAVMQGQA